MVPQCGQATVASTGVPALGDEFGELDNPPPIPLLSTIFTQAIDLERVPCGQVMVFAADVFFDFPDFGREEFHRRSALGAHHVVMAAAVVLVFVAGNAVVEGDFAGESALGEEFQSAINSGVADAGVFFLDETVKFVGGEVVTGFEEGAEDGVALRGLLESDIFEVAMKDVLRLADHLPRDGGLIIDALLQYRAHDLVSAYHR